MLILDSIISSAINNLSVFSESHNNIYREQELSALFSGLIYCIQMFTHAHTKTQRW